MWWYRAGMSAGLSDPAYSSICSCRKELKKLRLLFELVCCTPTISMIVVVWSVNFCINLDVKVKVRTTANQNLGFNSDTNFGINTGRKLDVQIKDKVGSCSQPEPYPQTWYLPGHQPGNQSLHRS